MHVNTSLTAWGGAAKDFSSTMSDLQTVLSDPWSVDVIVWLWLLLSGTVLACNIRKSIQQLANFYSLELKSSRVVWVDTAADKISCTGTEVCSK